MHLKKGKCFREGRESVLCRGHAPSPSHLSSPPHPLISQQPRGMCHPLHCTNETQVKSMEGAVPRGFPLPAEAHKPLQAVHATDWVPLQDWPPAESLCSRSCPFPRGNLCLSLVSVGASLAQILDTSENQPSPRAPTGSTETPSPQLHPLLWPLLQPLLPSLAPTQLLSPRALLSERPSHSQPQRGQVTCPG